MKLFYILQIFLLFTLETFAKEFKSYQPKNKKIFLEKNLDYKKFSSLKWQRIENSIDNPLYWEIIENKDFDSILQNLLKQKFSKKEIKIKSLDRTVVVNNIPYPEISHYVPNGYVSYSEKFVTTNLRAISKLRFCDGKNFEYKCADGILNIDFNFINTENLSFNPRFSMQSISNRGTKFGQESSLGFKLAKNISPNWSIAFGGENIIHLDKDIDLGRNYYLIGSTFKKLGSSNKNNPSILFLNIGIGSDFYGYKGNGFLWRAPCIGKPNLTGDANNHCSWGPIGSIAIAPNDRLTFVNEWFGYSYGSGISIKPFTNKNLTLSIYATDFIKGFPKYAEEHCPNNQCETRFYGNIGLSF